MAAQQIPSFASLRKDAAAKKAAHETAFDAFAEDPSEANGKVAAEAHRDFEQSALAVILRHGISKP